MLFRLEELGNLDAVAQSLVQTLLVPLRSLGMFVQPPQGQAQNIVVLEGDASQSGPVQAANDDAELVGLYSLADNLFLEVHFRHRMALVKTLEQGGQGSPIVSVLHKANGLPDQRPSGGNILPSVNMLELDFFISKSGVCRVIVQLRLELVAEDEMALALVQVCWDKVVVAKSEESIVEFGLCRLAKNRRADCGRSVVSKERLCVFVVCSM